MGLKHHCIFSRNRNLQSCQISNFNTFNLLHISLRVSRYAPAKKLSDDLILLSSYLSNTFFIEMTCSRILKYKSPGVANNVPQRLVYYLS